MVKGGEMRGYAIVAWRAVLGGNVGFIYYSKIYCIFSTTETRTSLFIAVGSAGRMPLG